LNGPEDLDNIGWENVMSGNGAVLIEWPERIESALPEERLWIELRILEPTRRNLLFDGNNARYREIVQRFREMTFGV
jgi:tRNA threonylcarbamoyladenosine biosynthesis protein TsaE